MRQDAVEREEHDAERDIGTLCEIAGRTLAVWDRPLNPRVASASLHRLAEAHPFR